MEIFTSILFIATLIFGIIVFPIMLFINYRRHLPLNRYLIAEIVTGIILVLSIILAIVTGGAAIISNFIYFLANIPMLIGGVLFFYCIYLFFTHRQKQALLFFGISLIATLAYGTLQGIGHSAMNHSQLSSAKSSWNSSSKKDSISDAKSASSAKASEKADSKVASSQVAAADRYDKSPAGHKDQVHDAVLKGLGWYLRSTIVDKVKVSGQLKTKPYDVTVTLYQDELIKPSESYLSVEGALAGFKKTDIAKNCSKLTIYISTDLQDSYGRWVGYHPITGYQFNQDTISKIRPHNLGFKALTEIADDYENLHLTHN